jgi:PIN domain nuclease of toxin-antitoxin system
LLDTHALLWFQAGDRRLSRSARQAMEAADAELLVSAATVWEMAIKVSLGGCSCRTG